MDARCIWSGRRSAETRKIEIETTGPLGLGRETATVHVLPQHEPQLRGFAALVNRRAKWMLTSILAALIVGVVGTLIAPSGWPVTGGVLAGLGALGIGATFLACPFPTPQTVAPLGIARSVRIVRVCAWILVVLGFFVIALAALSPILGQG